MRTQSLPAETLAAVCGVSVRQARRWRAARVPEWARRLVAVLHFGELAAIDAAFTGWRVRDGRLVSHDGRLEILAEQLGWFGWWPAQLNALQAEINALRAGGLDIGQRRAVWSAIESLKAAQAQAGTTRGQLGALLGAKKLHAEIEHDDRDKGPAERIRLRQRDNGLDRVLIAADREDDAGHK